jgi:hypothetical protein
MWTCQPSGTNIRHTRVDQNRSYPCINRPIKPMANGTQVLWTDGPEVDAKVYTGKGISSKKPAHHGDNFSTVGDGMQNSALVRLRSMVEGFVDSVAEENRCIGKNVQMFMMDLLRSWSRCQNGRDKGYVSETNVSKLLEVPGAEDSTVPAIYQPVIHASPDCVRNRTKSVHWS